MEAFNKVPGLGRKRLMQLNCCCIFLQIHFLSEITNSSGDALIPGFWSGDTMIRPAPPIHRYPRQVSPSPALWQLWRATIRKCFCTPCTTSLRVPLGPWLFTSYRRFPSITYYPLRLWHSPTHYSSYCKTTHQGIQFSSSHGTSLCTNSSLIPVDVRNTTHTIIIVNSCCTHLPATPPPALSLTNAVLPATLPPWKADLLSHLQFHLPLPSLSSLLVDTSTHTDHCILAACNGSSNTRSTFGWTLRHGTTDLATCYGPVHGYRANSYCAKATGLLSLLVFLRTVQSRSLTSPPLKLPIYCDNQALCTHIHQHSQRVYYSPSEALAPERDLILQIESLLNSPILDVCILHIKGHQDCDTPLPLLSPPAQANCKADHLASTAQSLTISPPTSYTLPASGCTIILNQSAITRQIPQALRTAAYNQYL